jgi:hypothetical protein
MGSPTKRTRLRQRSWEDGWSPLPALPGRTVEGRRLHMSRDDFDMSDRRIVLGVTRGENLGSRRE